MPTFFWNFCRRRRFCHSFWGFLSPPVLPEFFQISVLPPGRPQNCGQFCRAHFRVGVAHIPSHRNSKKMWPILFCTPPKLPKTVAEPAAPATEIPQNCGRTGGFGHRNPQKLWQNRRFWPQKSPKTVAEPAAPATEIPKNCGRTGGAGGDRNPQKLWTEILENCRPQAPATEIFKNCGRKSLKTVGRKPRRRRRRQKSPKTVDGNP